MDNRFLRIGNIIGAAFNDPVGFTCNVVGLREDEIMPDKDFNGMEGEWWGQGSFEGIEITEDWLLKFGFEKSYEEAPAIATWDEFMLNGIYLFNKGNGIQEYFYGNTQLQIQYVHQLQNLYLALTGEELVKTS